MTGTAGPGDAGLDAGRDAGLDAGLDDRALLRAHLDGDLDAFAALVRRHRDRLWAVALRTTGNPEDAADALQDALVSAYRRAASFRGDAAVTTWLHRVVVNACLDRMRAQKVRRAQPLPDDLDQGVPTLVAGGTGAEAEDPGDRAVQTDRRRMVLAALRELPPDQRAALVLVDMEGWSVTEAAQALGCAEGTVKSRCSRGRARLAVLLRPLLHDEPPDDPAPARVAPPPPADGNRPRSAPVPPQDAPRGPPPA
jgi:RNA polymerase sigma-70 factor (ECF subfamily)